ncbi:MAG: FG-GAP repeat protein, partial [Gammaproteobacteria bacterium]|nr:FG-GAP repeat protein [Gammaproteobacteria bacterium]
MARQGLRACFDAEGAHFTGARNLSLHLAAFGRGGKLAPVDPVPPEIDGNGVRYRHGKLTGWWRVLPVGFEQGFTIAERPSGPGKLVLALSTSRRPRESRDSVRESIRAAEPARAKARGRDSKPDWIPASAGMTEKSSDRAISWGKLRYGKLVVTDAEGKVIPATIGIAGKPAPTGGHDRAGTRILIAVNEARAVYPLSVDPVVWLEQRVVASDGVAQDWFGSSVAISGKTALVGAPNVTVDGYAYRGAVYVFTETGGTWTQTARLTAGDGVTGDEFGYSVALDGTIAVVGALGVSFDNKGGAGAAYVFVESGGSWSQVAKLTASDATFHARLGQSVAVSGRNALVGAPFANVNGNEGQGAAYVFSLSGGAWTQTREFSPNGCGGCGWSVAIDGGTALVGTDYTDFEGSAVYVFTESGGNWSLAQELTPNGSGFGVAVAIDGTTALIGAPLAYAGGHQGQGKAYVLEKFGSTWLLVATLAASDGAEEDYFGYSVDVDGTTALIGAKAADVGGNLDEGAAYVFDKAGGGWVETLKFTASDAAAGVEYGTWVALSGTTALVGAPHADIDGTFDQGAAYFYGGSDLALAVSAP